MLLDTLAAAMLSNSLFRFCNKSRLPNGQHQYPKLALNQCWNTLSGGALLLVHKPDLPVPIDTFYHVCCLDGKPRLKLKLCVNNIIQRLWQLDVYKRKIISNTYLIFKNKRLFEHKTVVFVVKLSFSGGGPWAIVTSIIIPSTSKCVRSHECCNLKCI